MATVKADEGSDLDSGGSAGGCGSDVDSVLMSIFEYHLENNHIKNRMRYSSQSQILIFQF